MENFKCSIHNEAFTHYCIKDAACICSTCHITGEHQGHPTESLDEAFEKKKKNLRDAQQKLVREKELIELQEERLQGSRKKAVAEAEKVAFRLKEVRKNYADMEATIKSDISKGEEQAATLISEVVLQRDEMARKTRRLEDLCSSSDPLTVLLATDLGDFCGSDGEEGKIFKEWGDLISKLEKQGKDESRNNSFLKDSLGHVSDTIRGFNADFFNRKTTSAPLRLDVRTAANMVSLSEDLKKVSETDEDPDVPQTPERFQEHPQVLSINSFSSGRHFFDVDAHESAEWVVGLCYPSIEREGEESRIDQNDKAWCLRVYYSTCDAIHGNEWAEILYYEYNNVRVYVDYEAGQVSFYELGDVITHLHTFTTTFTEPLHVACCVWNGSEISLGDVVSFEN